MSLQEDGATFSKSESDAFKIGLSARLKGLRVQLGRSQSDMDELLRLGKKSWQRCESGDHAAGSHVIAKLIQQGFNGNWLLTGEGPMTLKELNAERFDVETLEQAVKVLEGRLKAGKKTMEPKDKAKMVVSIYELLNNEEREGKTRADLILELLTMDIES